MKTIPTKLHLPEGNFIADADHFTKADLSQLINIYDSWINLSKSLRNFNARAVNLPEGLSEIAFCIFMNCVRLNNPKISGANTSFDAYSMISKKRIQIKSCSVLPDLTSFGPNSKWDEIYFQDFYKNGKWDYKFDIYKIPDSLIYNHKVNRRQTFKQMQSQGKRPRFSIFKDIIKKHNISPVMECDLLNP